MRGLLARLGIAGELLFFLWKRKLWWLIPFMVVMLLFSALIIVGQVTGLGPFIYPLF